MSGQNTEIVKLQIRRGPEAQLPILDQGEPAITTDTNKFFIGDGATNHQLANLGDLASVNTQLATKANQTDLGDVTTLQTTSKIVVGSVNENNTSIKDRSVSVKDKQFGAKGDNVTDDTVAFQSFFDYVVTNKVKGYIPAGTYKLTGTINVKSGAGWTVVGGGWGVSILLQYTNNIPILNMGYNSAGGCFAVTMSDFEFQYKNAQNSSYTSGNAMYFTDMYYECSFKRIRFQGWYGMKYQSGQVVPWGNNFDELVFTSACYGGAMDWTGVINAGPNNHFGRMFMDGANMVGPIFNNIKGYNWVIQNLEFINTQQGAQLMSFQSGSICQIGAIKLEGGTYNVAQNLISMLQGCQIKIGHFTLGGSGMNINPASGNFYIFKTNGGGNTGWLEIDIMNLTATTLSGNVYILEGGVGSMIIKYLNTNGANFLLSNSGGSSASDTISVEIWNNNRLSSDKGNTDYTIALGDPNNISFETLLTASRTVNLPGTNGNLFNGLKYRIRTYGAVNGTNVINIVCNANTIATLSTDKAVIEVMYRHNNSNAQGGWKVVGYNTLP